MLEFNEKLVLLSEENNPLIILTQMQNYLSEVISQGSLTRTKQYEFIKHMKNIEKAKQEISVNMNLLTVFENLSFNLVL